MHRSQVYGRADPVREMTALIYLWAQKEPQAEQKLTRSLCSPSYAPSPCHDTAGEPCGGNTGKSGSSLLKPHLRLLLRGSRTSTPLPWRRSRHTKTQCKSYCPNGPSLKSDVRGDRVASTHLQTRKMIQGLITPLRKGHHRQRVDDRSLTTSNMNEIHNSSNNNKRRSGTHQKSMMRTR